MEIKSKSRMQFRREITHADVGMVIINRFKDALVEISKLKIQSLKEEIFYGIKS